MVFIPGKPNKDDTLFDTTGDDQIVGYSGNDVIHVSGGNDTVDGGADTDTLFLDYGAFTDTVFTNMAPSMDANGGFDGSYVCLNGSQVSYTSIEKFNITTGSGADTIITVSGDDVVRSGAGNDVVDVGTGKDTADGGADFDTISADLSALGTAITWNLVTNVFGGASGRSFANFEAFGTITTGSGNDVITTGATSASETVITGAGKDTFTTVDGGDTFAAGAGADTLIIDYAAATNSVYANVGLSLNGIDGEYDGSFYNNTQGSYITFTSVGTFNITTGSGIDTITTGAGNDVVKTGAGNDMVDVGTGTDSADGGADFDGISADLSDATGAVIWNLVTNSFSGGPDTFLNFEYFGTITTGSGNDVITTGATSASETVITGGGADTFTTVDGGDTFAAGAGADTLIINYATATNSVYANVGLSLNGIDGEYDGSFYNNTQGAYISFTSVGTFNITTGSGVDTITTGAGNDVVKTGAGNDMVDVGTGTDSADGGADFDGISADLSDATGAVIWNLVTNSFSGGPDTFLNFEYFGTITTAGGNDVITTGATSASETVITGGGADTFTTVDGGDTFAAGAGADTLIINYAAATASVYANVGLSLNGADGEYDGSFYNNTQGSYVSFTSVGTFNITTGSGADTIATATGNDIIKTGGGDDSVSAGAGNDLVEGGGGNDVLDGGDDSDTVSYASAANAVTVSLNTTAQQNTMGAGRDTLSNFENLTGSGLADTLTGSDVANIIDGGVGADRMTGLKGDDTYIVDDLGDTVIEAANAGTDLVRSSVTFTLGANVENLTLTGTAFANGTGNDGDNVILGNSGYNVIEGGLGNDTLDGGIGAYHDLVSYEHSAAGVTVSLAITTQQNTVGAGLDTLTNFWDLKGSAQADRLTGDAKGNYLYGLGGDDILTGGAGNDTLYGGAGIDTAVFSGSWADYAIDTLDGSVFVHDLRAGAPDGTNDVVSGDVEKIQLANGTFNAADVVERGPTGVGDTAAVTEAGRDGPGTPNASGNVLSNDTDPNLLVVGLGERLSVTGVRAGNSGAFTTISGATVINGIYGTLTIDADGTYTYALDNSRPATDALASGQVVQDIFSYTLADLHGVASQAVITVSVTGDDDATAGNDTLQVTLGRTSSLDASVLLANDGGSGLTVTGVSNATGGTVLLVDGKLQITAADASGGFDYTVAIAGGGTLTGHVDFSAVTPGKKFDIVAPDGVTAVDYVGANKADHLTGGEGNDRLVGSGGKDTLDGGAGADRMEGGAGSDTYYVDNAGDVVVETDPSGTDTVITTLASYALTANVEKLVYAGNGDFTGVGNDVRNIMVGGAGNDTLSGGLGADQIDGGAGNDALHGGDNADKLTGGVGDDVLDGGDGVDTASYLGSAGVTVDLGITVQQDTGGAGKDTLTSIENLIGSRSNDTLTGNDVANVIDASGGKDTILGNGGNDTLIGGGGADTMTGGAGRDTFVYQALSDINGDRITDFSHAEHDVLDFSIVDADELTDGVQHFTFIGTAAFTGAGGANFELRYQAAATPGDLTVQGDINHDGVADFSFTVHAPALQASDFLLIPA